MSDRNVPPEELARLRVQQVIEDELARAGIELDPWQVTTLTADFLAGERNKDTDQMMALLELGQGRAGTPANQGFPGEATAGFRDDQGRPVPLFGKHADEIWLKQREGWDGYGWTKDKIRELGRNPEPRELSRGGRWANTWEANKNFLEGLLKQGESIEGVAARMDMSGMPEAVRHRVLSGLLNEHDRIRKQTHGESGWMGAMVNPEYLAGQAFGALSVVPEAAHMQTLDTADPRENPYYIPEHLKSSWLADPVGNLGHQAMQFFGHYVPKAWSQIQTDQQGAKVEPTMPVGSSPADGNRQIFEASERRNLTLDELNRLQAGKYPSYAASGVATLLNGLLDPSIVATGPAAHLTHAIGRGLSGAGKAIGRGTLGGNFMRRWGSNLMRDASWAKQYPYAAAAMREAGDELPFGAGLQGVAAAASGTMPPFSQWFTASNEARTDMPQETQEEFVNRMNAVQGHSQDAMNKNFDLEARIRQSQYPERRPPEAPLMQRLGGMGAGGH